MRAVLTIPNALSMMRAFGIPLFLWVVLVHGSPLWGVLILVVGGATDYLDGKLARALHQESRLGELLDPAVDRLYIIAIIFALYSENVLPGWVVALLFGRDLFLGLLLIFLRRYGVGPFKVTYLGKAATFNLLYALPCLLLVDATSGLLSDVAFVFGWAFTHLGNSALSAYWSSVLSERSFER
ncbi:MAG: CDP-alcohol phosphatidyltransferase family protein [Actinobacteria bacterium]|nr:CDP-alcohol phosphatidyltransferase family protein [Actinomycetota bacterium]